MPILIQLKFVLEQVVVGNVTDKDKDAIGRQIIFFPGDGVLGLDANNFAFGVAHNFGRHGVPDKFHLLILEGALLQNLAGAQLVAPVQDTHTRSKLGQEKPLLHRAITAADHNHILTAEEEAVTGAAIADPFAGVLLLAGNIEVARAGAGG